MHKFKNRCCCHSCSAVGCRGEHASPVFQFLADQLTLYQLGGQIMLTYVLHAHLDFQTLRRACLLWQDLQCMHWRSSPKPLSTIMWQWQNISPIILFIAHILMLSGGNHSYFMHTGESRKEDWATIAKVNFPPKGHSRYHSCALNIASGSYTHMTILCEMEFFNFLWLIWVHYLPLPPT